MNDLVFSRIVAPAVLEMEAFMSSAPQNSQPESRAVAQQFLMLRPHLDNLPVVVCPDGYEVRALMAGEEQAWENVIKASFQTVYSFERHMRADYGFGPGRVMVVAHQGQIVATASAWYRNQYGRETGCLHMVGVLPGHAGKSLGYWVSLACLHVFAKQGRRQAVLKTDDHRVPAIKTYLKLGFEPLVVCPSHPLRWRKVFEGLGMVPLSERIEARLSAPVMVFDDTRPELDSPERYRPRKVWLADRLHRGGAVAGGDPECWSDEVLYKSSQLGKFSLSPGHVNVGEPMSQNLAIVYTTGQQPLGPGSIVRFEVRGQNPLGIALPNERNLGKMLVEVKAPGHAGVVPFGTGFKVETGTLYSGDRVNVVVLADPSQRWSPLAIGREVRGSVELGTGQPQMYLPSPRVIRFEHGPMSQLKILLPGSRQVGALSRVSIRCVDDFDNPVSHSVRVQIERPGKQSLWCDVHHGCLVLDLDLGDLPVIRVTGVAQHDGRAFEAVSNPSVLEQDFRLCFGDLHCHDMLSASEGYPDEVHEWARDHARLDFVSVTPQCHAWIDNQKWTITKLTNQRFLEDHRFVTLLGFEWQHAQFGDKVVHYLSGAQPYLPVDHPQYLTPGRLYEALRQSDAFVVSHHPGYPAQWVPGTDYQALETDMERVIEIWSMHGSSEGYDPSDRPLSKVQPDRTVYSALRSGVRLGFIAGSDSHSARPGGSAPTLTSYPGGIACVWARELTREGLFEAVRARRTYAITQARIVLMFEVNGHPMGSEITFTPDVMLKVRAVAPGVVAKVELMKDTQVWKVFSPQALDVSVEAIDRISAPAFYHARVTLVDGNLAVSSPVWVG